jgi:hypothetical protein
MSRKFPQALIALLFGIFIFASPSHSFAASASGGGACPTGSNYLSLSSPQTGGGQGSVTLSSLGVTSCFYVSAAGSDSNSGTSESSPWLHAPGMPSCSSNCASVSPSAGMGFIFRGGDTWHQQTGSPQTGGSWNWNYTGSSGSPIYWGIDPTWSSGSSFARPIFNQDNAPNTHTVSNCSYADDGSTFLTIGGSHQILDGFEFTGNCMSGSGDDSIVNALSGNTIITERNYVHGWSMTAGVGDDGGVKFGDTSNSTGNTTNRHLFDVVDGSDSTFGNSCTTTACVGSGTATGWAFGDGYDVEYTVIRHVSNGIQAGQICILIGNSMEYEFEPTISGRHGNVVEQNFGGCNVGLFYNNVTGNVDEGIDWITNDLTFYVFNNVWFNDQHYAPDPNGYLMCGGGSGSNVVHAYFYNNTAQDIKLGACTPSSDGGGWSSGSSIQFANNQLMDFTNVSSIFNCNGQSCGITDNGGEIYETTAAANAEGYTYANNWEPTASSNATVGTGNDMGSFCNSLPNSAAVTACQAGSPSAVSETTGWGGYIASYSPAMVNSRGSAWDAGAYQFSGNSSSPNPPSGLSAVVQ